MDSHSATSRGWAWVSVLKRLVRAGGAAGLLAVLMACAHQAGSVPGTRDTLLATSGPGWRITQVVPNLTVGGLWAGGARDAWLAGDACADLATCGVSDTSNGTVIVRHWDGTSWQPVKLPRAYVNTPLDQGAGPVAATSGSNAWIAAYRGTESIDSTDMLHWTGKGWAAPVRVLTAIQAAIAPSATQLWAFGNGTKAGQAGYFAHFTGQTWVRGSFPLSGTAAAASSPADVWVGGSNANGEPGIEHWDGNQWRATPLPGLGLRRSETLFLADVSGIAIVNKDDVWADITTIGTGSVQTGMVLFHWNGKTWARPMFPYAGTTIAPVAPDGHGGVWLVLEASGSQEQWFCHFSAGRWTRTPGPRRSGEQPVVDNLAWIPGTHSLWAAGSLDRPDIGTAILKYGN